MAAKVILGEISISPGPREKISFNSPRSITKIDIPGGAPIYQDMGEDETTLTWEGVFTGDDAYSTALAVESLKDAGKAIALVIPDFPELSKKVRIRSFPWDVIRADRIEYSIELVAEPPEPVVSKVVTTTTSSGTATAAAATTATPSKSATIKQGDTLWGLAVKYYGNGARWREIASANGITDPRKLKIGQNVKIPG